MINRCSHIVLLLLVTQISLLAQEDLKIKKKHFKTGIETGFKEAWKSVKEGDKYYARGKGTYDLARDHYLYANQYNPDNAALNYKIGVCYLSTRMTSTTPSIIS